MVLCGKKLVFDINYLNQANIMLFSYNRVHFLLMSLTTYITLNCHMAEMLENVVKVR